MVPNGSGVNVSMVNAPPKLVKVIMASSTEQVNGYMVNGGTVVGFKDYDAVTTRLVSGVNRFTVDTDSTRLVIESRLTGNSSFTLDTEGTLVTNSVLAGTSAFTVDSNGLLTIAAILGQSASKMVLESVGKVNSVTFSDVVGEEAYVVDPINMVFIVESSQEFSV